MPWVRIVEFFVLPSLKILKLPGAVVITRSVSSEEPIGCNFFTMRRLEHSNIFCEKKTSQSFRLIVNYKTVKKLN